MPASPDWDGAPNWDKEPEVSEQYIRYIDINVQAGDDGKGMMHGEYESMKVLHKTMPELVPNPIAWGTYFTAKDIHFLLCEFHDMDEGPCSLDTLPELLAELHKKGVSPTGQFGFPIATYQGRLPQDPTWCDTWEECFSRNLDIMFEHELQAQGPGDAELAELRRTVMTRVVPRLLRPMESGGRRVVPRLIHGDLWEGNAGTDRATAIPKIFDACSWYAHNEFEMAPWRPARQEMGKPYVDAYIQHFPPAEPTEDFDGRNTLYALRFNLCSSALYPGNLNYRNVVKSDLRELVKRYPETFEEWQERQI
ncbi:Fructosamine kinase-domain-containing protein [Apiospora hydei]|uniref:protein-ribulosamine 3-kinase n=1 Tax=Apiospora hydei TaxID=1337664 RepID=A0ABR1V8H0_9PEZI